MNALKLSPVLLSALLLAAHFFRIEEHVIVVICVCFPFLLLFRKKWAARIIQLILCIGSLEWFRTIYIDIELRMQENESWLRLAIILGMVAVFTALSSLVFRFKTIRKIYGFNTKFESSDISKNNSFTKYIILLLLLVSIFNSVAAQNIQLKGKVETIDSDNKRIPLSYANVYWFGKNTGTTTDEAGMFTLQKPALENLYLIVSYVGFTNDTILVPKNQTQINIHLERNLALQEVIIGEKKEANYMSKISPIQTQVITSTGLQKLACCNLSESFENNATVDVAYTDAVSGAKQIQMLGLAGIYSQLMSENIPSIRGLAISHGLGYIPGPWMESIQISKGTSSVINGYESITGQINVEYKKPENSDKLHLNVYANELGKVEGNLTSAYRLNNNLSTIIMLHGENFASEIDRNHDNFLDLPKTSQINIFNKWRYEYKKKFVTQFGVKYLSEERDGGQIGFDKDKITNSNLYGIGINTKRYEVFAKAGIPLTKPENSLGFLLNTSGHNQNSFFGNNLYSGNQKSFYSNIIYQFIINNTDHNISTGISYQYDKYDEHLINAATDTIINKTENIPGVFAQYTYSFLKQFTLIAGFRADLYNTNQKFLTPRLHLKYDLNKKTILKASAGKGYRTANVLSENMGILASSRKFIFSEALKPEEAWNYGASLTRYFSINKNKATFILDFYRTDFINQVIVDMDSKYSEVSFNNLKGKSYSNSAQAEVIFEPIKRFEINAAFRLNDVWMTINNKLEEKPFTNRYKGLLSLSYSTKYDKWQFDFTTQYNGISRLPNTDALPEQYKQENIAHSFYLLSAMITKRFKWWNLYAGVENLTNFRQKQPIIASEDPFGPYFDTSFLWGPILGRTIYVGLRFSIK